MVIESRFGLLCQKLDRKATHLFSVGLTGLAFGSANLCAACSESPPSANDAGMSAPTSLAILAQPSAAATSGSAFGQQPSVQLLNSSSAPVNQAGMVVTASMASGSGNLGGGTTATTNGSGLATFSNLSITGFGTFTVQFSAPGLTSATSNAITVMPGGAPPEPTPSGTIVFDSRAGGAQSFQSANTLADVRAYFTANHGNGAGELVDGSSGHWDFTTNYDGKGKHALRVDWSPNPGAESQASSIFYYPTTINQLYWSVTIHLGRTSTGGGVGNIGSFSPVSPTGGMKRLLFLRRKDDGTDRMYFVWNASNPAAVASSITIDNRNFTDYFTVDLGIGVDVRWTGRIIPASSSTAKDGIVQVWRNGVLVLNDQAAAIGNLPFQEKEMVATRWNCTQNETEYWTDLVVWRP